MNRYLYYIFIFHFFSCYLQAQILINEILSSNLSYANDDYGDYDGGDYGDFGNFDYNEILDETDDILGDIDDTIEEIESSRRVILEINYN